MDYLSDQGDELPETQEAAPASTASENKVDRQNDQYSNTSLMNLRQAELIAASQHFLDLGERASFEFLRDIVRGRDVMATCADFSRIHTSTYRTLVTAISAPVSGVLS